MQIKRSFRNGRHLFYVHSGTGVINQTLNALRPKCVSIFTDKKMLDFQMEWLVHKSANLIWRASLNANLGYRKRIECVSDAKLKAGDATTCPLCCQLISVPELQDHVMLEARKLRQLFDRFEARFSEV